MLQLWGKELSVEVVLSIRCVSYSNEHKYLNTAQPESAQWPCRFFLYSMLIYQQISTNTHNYSTSIAKIDNL